MNAESAHKAKERNRWGSGVAAVLAFSLTVGCGGRKTLSGKDVSLEAKEAVAITDLITKAAGLVSQGKDQQVLALMKKDLPKAEQAAVIATLKKVSRARAWKVEQVSRFSPSYFRALVSLEGEPTGSVTINFLRQDDRLAFTGSG